MQFLIESQTKHSNPEEIESAFARYHAYLESIRRKLPASAYDFASATWHYDHNDHRCPHDAWVESVLIRESSSGNRYGKRQLEIVARLLGAFHDGYLELSYPGVRSYALSTEIKRTATVGHGDWLVDEVCLLDNNLVLHEILFSNGGRWLIESSDIQFRWVPYS
jgi:hypothetical protein